ncbi:MAG: hypothetical protein JST83_08285 [Bacteroidetes bacterium]|nr:hypothetical protein [Bacteroidota bacterium]
MILRIRKSRFFRLTTALTLCTMLLQMALPLGAYALTAGPASPEFSKFTPVTTSDMVNITSGDFSYNLPVIDVPGPHGSGYPLALSYHAGHSAEEEASWVGLGWTLNPGSISRNLRGFPDDYKNTRVERYNKTRKNWTASVGNAADIKIYSTPIGIGVSTSVKYNSYTGLMRTYGLGLDVKGMVNIGFSFSGSSFTLNGGISPMAILHNKKAEKDDASKAHTEKRQLNYKQKWLKGVSEKKMKERVASNNQSRVAHMTNTAGIFSFGESERQLRVAPYKGLSFNFNLGVYFPLYIPAGISLNQSASYSSQEPIPATDERVYGYYYNQPYEPLEQGFMSDYSVEKSTPFSRRDVFLGIPFNNYDIYSVDGEGISGGFRAHNSKLGQHRPPSLFYKEIGGNTLWAVNIPIIQVGVDVACTDPVGIDINLGVGDQMLLAEGWASPCTNGTPSNKLLSGYDYDGYGGYFRFNNDMGGSQSFSDADLVNVASLDIQGVPLPGTKFVTPSISSSSLTPNRAGVKPNSSNFIDQMTNANINTLGHVGFTHDANINSVSLNATRSNSDNASDASLKYNDGIGAYKIVNPDGQKYYYELPVYSREEYALRYNALEPVSPDVDYNKRAYISGFNGDPSAHLSEDHRQVIGEHKPVPYATDYLLTQVTSSDYYDINSDGPSADDFGSWTKFDYKRKYGGNGDWYKWRAPYNGMNYTMQENSERKEDVYSFTCGEKEVYYLKTVETATHIAFFVTNKTTAADFDYARILGVTSATAPTASSATAAGRYIYALLSSATASGDQRQDGVDADNIATACQDRSKKGSHQLEYLEKIVLISKADLKSDIASSASDVAYANKVVYFEYDNSLVPDILNFIANSSNTNGNTGKLTLKKVWFEYEGVRRATISPYVFKYEYMPLASFPSNVTQRYPDIFTASTAGSYASCASHTAAEQNPSYSDYALDDWGAFQEPQSSKLRSKEMRPGVNQQPPPEFDPAAYQLKQIMLPTGGEILVQYEQDDYQYVQNRRAMCLAALTNYSTDGYASNDTKYYLNTESMGIASTDWSAYVNELKKYFGANGERERIYFKFLYAMMGYNAALKDCQAEYISGYAEVQEVNYDGTGVYIRLRGAAGGKIDLPRKACWDFVANNKGGKLTPCDGIDDLASGSFHNAKSFFSSLAQSIVYQTPAAIQTGKAINYQHSYLKVPMLYEKKGGGLRVKRLMLYDDGMESGDAHLYGQEYQYKTEKGESSGVATNEPSTMHEENALVTQLRRSKQNWFNKIIYGRDKKVTEGPIGESILPPPSVTYSRVVIKNIYQGASASGYSVQEYFTTWDFPFDGDYDLTGVGQRDFNHDHTKGVDFTAIADNKEKDYMMLPTPYFSYQANKVWIAQGFRFIVNRMNGLPKRFSIYGNTPQSNGYLISSESYDYYKPGEKVKALKYDNVSHSFTNEYILPGKEEDMCMEMNGLTDMTFDFSFNIGVDVTICMPPIVWVTVGGFQVNLNDASTATHTTSKVLYYPAIMKQKTVIVDNMKNTTEYIAFSEETGQPIVTKTYDGYNNETLDNSSATHNGAYYNLNLPASWFYPDMGRMSEGITNSNTLGLSAGSIGSYGDADLSDATKLNALTQSGVLYAKINTYKKDFSDADINSEYNIPTSYTSTPQFYRPFSSYVYLTSDILEASGGTSNRNYSGGVINTADIMSNIKSGNIFGSTPAISDPKWKLTNQTMKVSPHGEPLEEKNALGIYTAAHYGYYKALPVTVGQNVQYSNLVFEAFEDEKFASNQNLTAIAHSGNKSYQLASGAIFSDQFSNISISSQIQSKGLLVSAWVKPSSTKKAKDLLSVKLDQSTATSIKLEEAATVNGWTLINVRMTGISTSGGSTSTGRDMVSFKNKSTDPADALYLDDIRIQPLDGEAKSFVYNPSNLKLVAEFDNNHFGTFYQYNAEGQLTRKMVETQEGIKTIVETQYNTKTVSR